MTALIFQQTWQWVLDVSPHTGLPKTQTSRLVKPGELGVECVNNSHKIYAVIWTAGGRIKWETGCTRAIKPGRTLPSVLWRGDPALFHLTYSPETHDCTGREWKEAHLSAYDDYSPHPEPWREARVQINEIRRQDVRYFTRGDFQREGFADKYHFLFVWTMMHDTVAHDLYPAEEAEDLSILKWWESEIWQRPKDRYDAWVLLFSFIR